MFRSSRIWDSVLKAKISQRNRFLLLLVLCLSVLVDSLTALLLAKQLPDLLGWAIKEVLKIL